MIATIVWTVRSDRKPGSPGSTDWNDLGAGSKRMNWACARAESTIGALSERCLTGSWPPSVTSGTPLCTEPGGLARCRSLRCEGVGFAGQGGKCGCDLGEASADVGAGRAHGACALAGVLMARVRLRDGETEAALDPRQDGVADPVRADLLGLHPRLVLAKAVPERRARHEL